MTILRSVGNALAHNHLLQGTLALGTFAAVGLAACGSKDEDDDARPKAPGQEEPRPNGRHAPAPTRAQREADQVQTVVDALRGTELTSTQRKQVGRSAAGEDLAASTVRAIFSGLKDTDLKPRQQLQVFNHWNHSRHENSREVVKLFDRLDHTRLNAKQQIRVFKVAERSSAVSAARAGQFFLRSDIKRLPVSEQLRKFDAFVHRLEHPPRRERSHRPSRSQRRQRPSRNRRPSNPQRPHNPHRPSQPNRPYDPGNGNVSPPDDKPYYYPGDGDVSPPDDKPYHGGGDGGVSPDDDRHHGGDGGVSPDDSTPSGNPVFEDSTPSGNPEFE